MTRVRFNTYPSDSNTAWGHDVENVNGQVWGNVPDDRIAAMVEAGRIFPPIVETPKAPKQPEAPKKETAADKVAGPRKYNKAPKAGAPVEPSAPEAPAAPAKPTPTETPEASNQMTAEEALALLGDDDNG